VSRENEVNCYNVTVPYGKHAGRHGNLCHVDCANQGICDYSTGTCNCFKGFYGSDCTRRFGLQAPNDTMIESGQYKFIYTNTSLDDVTVSAS
jgi:hypothetical protein